jgi:hypothetical protein
MNPPGLKVLMISSDRNIFVPGSAVSERMKEYGSLVEELHIIVLCDASHTSSLKIENGKLIDFFENFAKTLRTLWLKMRWGDGRIGRLKKLLEEVASCKLQEKSCCKLQERS